jgi:hypothetical protein
MRRPIAAAERLFQEGLFSHVSCVSKVGIICKASKTIYIDLLAQNRLKPSVWQWKSSRYFSMHLIVASVWYWPHAIRWK